MKAWKTKIKLDEMGYNIITGDTILTYILQ